VSAQQALRARNDTDGCPPLSSALNGDCANATRRMDVAPPQTSAQSVDVREIGELIRARRQAQKISLRELQDELNGALTASALSRIENGSLPEPRNAAILAQWLGLAAGRLEWPGSPATEAPKKQSTPELVEVHLRADKKLSPVAAEVLARTFRVLYDDIVHGRIPLAQGKPEK
jgi:transcriptional regulator with XRE-family HTH domain